MTIGRISSRVTCVVSVGSWVDKRTNRPVFLNNSLANLPQGYVFMFHYGALLTMLLQKQLEVRGKQQPTTRK